MLEKLGKIIGFRPSLPSSPLIARFFSISKIKFITKDDPETPEKPWAKGNAARKLRYHNDAAYREQVLTRNKNYRARDLQQFKQTMSQRHKHRYQQDAAYQEQQRKRNLAMYKDKYSQDPKVHLRRRLHDWTDRHPGFMSSLPWKTHRPLHYPEKVSHFCQGCNDSRHGGLRFWWARLDQDKYDCPACYTKDHHACMPRGYEGITKWKDMVARRNELERLGRKNKSPP